MSRDHLRQGLSDLLAGASVVGFSERQLLDRFVAARDESAFAAIIARHGPMVIRVCRSVLTNPSDIDDAFQATFLVLLRKAGSLRDGDQLSPWLHGVARRVSLRARSAAAQRSGRESTGGQVEPTAADPALQSAEVRELAGLIHAELDRLSLAERSAILLCDLQGLTHQEAADQLGWPLGTVKSRVTRGRDRLRARLIRRGVTLPAGALAAGWWTQTSASAIVAPALAAATTRAAVAWAAGRALSTSLVAVSVLSLTQGVSRTMIFTKLKAGAVALAVASSVVAVPTLVAYQNPDPGGTTQPEAKPTSVEVRKAAKVESKSKTANAATDLSAIRVTLAQTAVDTITNQDPEKTNISDGIRFQWMRQLAEAELAQASTHDDRVKVMTRQIARLEKLGDQRAQAISSRIGPLLASDSLSQQINRLDAAWVDLRAVAEELATARKGLATIQDETNSLSPPQTKRIETRNGLGGMGMGGGMGLGGGMGMGMGMGMGGGMGGGGFVDRPAQSTMPGTQEAFGQQIALRNERLHQILKSTPNDDKANQTILQKMEDRVAMNFPNETPLADLVQYVRQATKDKTGFPDGLPIYIDPRELENEAVTDQSTIAINLEGVPLRTTFNLALKQLGLTYIVENGLVIVVSLASQNYPITPPPLQNFGAPETKSGRAVFGEMLVNPDAFPSSPLPSSGRARSIFGITQPALPACGLPPRIAK